jgi:hypothetical protein
MDKDNVERLLRARVQGRPKPLMLAIFARQNKVERIAHVRAP